MLKKLSVIFILGMAVMLLLVSCQRAASTSPQGSLATPTGHSTAATMTQPTGIGPVQMIGTTQMLQTMTAVSMQTQAAQTLVPGGTHPTSTPFGTPISVVPPTGVASTPIAGTTPIIIVPTSTPGHPATYTLMQGEFPYCIARRFNVNQQELLSLNGLTDTTPMQPGTVLRIPQTSNPFVGERALHPHPGVFTVSSATETIYAVACYYGDIDPNQIIAANNLISPYTLHINQTLNIP
jgi:LysM repeat protein